VFPGLEIVEQMRYITQGFVVLIGHCRVLSLITIMGAVNSTTRDEDMPLWLQEVAAVAPTALNREPRQVDLFPSQINALKQREKRERERTENSSQFQPKKKSKAEHDEARWNSMFDRLREYK